MSILAKNIEELVAAGMYPAKTVRDSIKSTGKKAVGCFPVYTPDEIIYAAGMLPIGLWGGVTKIKEADRYLQSFCCSIMRANMELGIKGTYDILSAVVITAYCDTLKALVMNWPAAMPDMKVMVVPYPQNREEPAGFDFLMDKFEIFKKECEALSGTAVTEERLEWSFAIYENYRRAMRLFTKLAATHPLAVNAKTRHYVIKAGYFLDKKIYTEKLDAINDELQKLPEEKSKVKVILTGLLAEPGNFLDLFAENGIAIAGDDLAQESRQFRTVSRRGGSVFSRLAYRVIDLRGCTFFYEEMKSRGQMLINLAKDNGADGIVVCMYKFCDPEEFDYPVYKKEIEQAGIPLLYLEIEQQMDSVEQLRTRIESFTELLLT